MHFLRELLHKKPLESNYLVYGRAVTLMTMTLLFLCFCGFLISQLYFDQYLIQTSSEEISNDTDTPDIEICVQNSTMRVVKCNAMLFNWTSIDVPNCWERFFRRGVPEPGSTSVCYVFETNNSYRMATGLTVDNRVALRRLDFYWNIDSLYNLSFSTASVPAIAVQLYDPHFSFWKLYTLGKSQVEEEAITNLRLGATRSTAMFNYTTSIFYFPEKYRAIRPFDASSIIGFIPTYIDIITLRNFQHNWPLLPNPPASAFNRSLYQGLFSVQLGQSTIDVKTEVRQYTLLASVGLAGGCYGLLTSIYIFLFGMTRLTPWGLVHHIHILINRSRNGRILEEEEHKLDNILSVSKRDSVLIPWKEQTSDAISSKSDIGEKVDDPSKWQESEVNSYSNPNDELGGLHQLLRVEKEKSEDLATRVQKLEIILTEYFLDIAYLDKIRHRKKISANPTNTDNDDQSSDKIEQ